MLEEIGAYKGAWDLPLLSGLSTSCSGGMEMGRQSDWEEGGSESSPQDIPGDWEAVLSASLSFYILL